MFKRHAKSNLQPNRTVPQLNTPNSSHDTHAINTNHNNNSPTAHQSYPNDTPDSFMIHSLLVFSILGEIMVPFGYPLGTHEIQMNSPGAPALHPSGAAPDR